MSYYLLKSKILFFFITALFMTGCSFSKSSSENEPLSATEFLLNTVVTVSLYDVKDPDILDECFQLCKTYENLFSRTTDASDISRINQNGSLPTDVSAETVKLLNAGLYYSELSDGAFDITIAPLSSLWDFTADPFSVPDAGLIDEARKKVNWKQVIITGTNVSLTEGGSLDLGAIAKGYIADCMKSYLESKGVKSALINLGGNLLTVGSKPDGSAFRIGIQKPFGDTNETIGYLEINDYSIVTSGIYERYAVTEGTLYHHIINPKTGYPYDNNLNSVTIVSKCSIDGDALSTVCFALGLENGMELIESLDDTEAIFITKDNQIYYSEGIGTRIPANFE
jgi:thiamine biosynthesis lipoprotein